VCGRCWCKCWPLHHSRIGLVGPTGTVHAFEPSAGTFESLLRNLQLNECQNVTANRLALSNTKNPLVLRNDPRHPSFDAHRFVAEAQTAGALLKTDEIVEGTTLDDYMRVDGARAGDPAKINFMKIDVEGAELSVLQGAAEALAHADDLTLMLECKNRDDVAEFLAKYGFSFFVWDGYAQELKSLSFKEAVRQGNENIFVRRKPWKGYCKGRTTAITESINENEPTRGD